MLSCPDSVTISSNCNKDVHVYFVVTYFGLGIFVNYGYLSCPCMYTVVTKAMKIPYLGNYTR